MPHAGSAAAQRQVDSAAARHCGGIRALRLLRRPGEMRLESPRTAVGVLACGVSLTCLVEGTRSALRVRSADSDRTAARRCGCIFALRCGTRHTPRGSSWPHAPATDNSRWGEGVDAVDSCCRCGCGRAGCLRALRRLAPRYGGVMLRPLSTSPHQNVQCPASAFKSRCLDANTCEYTSSDGHNIMVDNIDSKREGLLTLACSPMYDTLVDASCDSFRHLHSRGCAKPP